MLNLKRLFQVTFWLYQSGKYQVVMWKNINRLNVKNHMFFTTQKSNQSQKPLFKNTQKMLETPSEKNKGKDSSSQGKNKPKYQRKKIQQEETFSIPTSKSTQKISLNPTQSLHSHIMRIRSIDTFVEFYAEHKIHFNPRLLSIACRNLCSLCEKQKSNIISHSTMKKLQTFLRDIFSLNISIHREQIKKQQLKNFLYFMKKSLNELAKLFGLNPQNVANYNDQLYQQAQSFRTHLTQIFLHEQFDYSNYEVNQIIEIYYELIRLSAQNQTPKIYEAILKNKQKIQQTVNPQFLFSTGNFLLTAKTIQMEQMGNKQNQRQQQKNGKLFSRQKQAKVIYQKSDNQKIKHLREQCYRIFLDKWLYYYDDMAEFIKLQDLKHSWPLIVQSYTGVKILLQKDNGQRAIKIVSKILEIHKCKFDKLWSTNMRVLGNTYVLFQLLINRHNNTGKSQIKSVRKYCLQQISDLPSIQRSKLKLRIKSFLQNLKRKNIVQTQEQRQLIDKVSKI